MSTSGSSSRARWLFAAALLIAALAVGCGPLRYVSGVTGGASSAVDEARAAKAEELAPYWWTRAVEYLARARHEAAAADWQAANRFGRLAREAAETAVTEANAAAADPDRRPLPQPDEQVAPAKDARDEKLAPAREPAPKAKSAKEP